MKNMETTKINGYIVYNDNNPRDFFNSSTVKIEEWVKNLSKEEYISFNLSGTKECIEEYEGACEVLRNLEIDSDQLREVRVAYNHITDHHYFIFKYENNGTTVIIEKDL